MSDLTKEKGYDLVETEWFSSILVVMSRPISGELSHIKCKFCRKYDWLYPGSWWHFTSNEILLNNKEADLLKSGWSALYIVRNTLIFTLDAFVPVLSRWML